MRDTMMMEGIILVFPV